MTKSQPELSGRAGVANTGRQVCSSVSAAASSGCQAASDRTGEPAWLMLCDAKPKFHYADFPVTSATNP